MVATRQSMVLPPYEKPVYVRGKVPLFSSLKGGEEGWRVTHGGALGKAANATSPGASAHG